MKMHIDADKNINSSIVIEEQGQFFQYDLYSKAGFEALTRLWVKVGWNQKYQYTFTWMGRPMIQLPEDVLRVQEVIYATKPDVILETGVAHGGSLIFYASLCKAMGKGRVIGVDIEIRPNNRNAIETHELFPLITLLEGDSASSEILNRVRTLIQPGEKVLVLLDSNHSKDHVLRELEAYHNLVAPGSYIVATDGIMNDLYDVPRGVADWIWNNPAEAAQEFLKTHPEFILEQPGWPFNESELERNITHWPGAWLKRQTMP